MGVIWVLASFQLLPEQPLTELPDSIRIADELGYYACYSADEIYHKDAWMVFAAAARATERIRLGPLSGADLHARADVGGAAGRDA